MKLILICAVSSLLGCQVGATTPQATIPPDELADILDQVLSDWVRNGADVQRVDNDVEGIVLMRRNLPQGYRPRVPGRRIVVADYFVPKQSSYEILERAQKPGEVYLREGEDNIGPLCIYIEGISIEDGVVTIQLAMNKRFNLGASSARYTAKRTPDGWVVTGRGPVAVS